jgi:hypothetical protein
MLVPPWGLVRPMVTCRFFMPREGAEMMRRLMGVLAVAGCLDPAWAAPEPKPNASPVCLYESKAYSEGAFVCVQKSLMLTCTTDGARVSWKPVADRDINDRCTVPTVQYASPELRPHRHRRHFVVRRIHPLVDNPAKCFIFNGVRYCE